MGQSRWKNRWRRLDNTAKIFPVIANENVSQVFRISATLKEPVNPELLSRALEEILPEIRNFRVKLRRGLFWYYFEENDRIPQVKRENTYPCRFIDPHGNQRFLFRVTYYEKRINLEVFHALTDGLGAVNFLKCLTRQYLRLAAGASQFMTWDDENYYLVAYDSEAGIIKHYRVDKMEKISTLDEERDGQEVYQALDMAVYTRKTFGMFTGEEIKVQMRFENHLVGAVLDRLGSEVFIVPDGPAHFTVRTDVVVSPQFFAWVLGFGSQAQIVGPAHVVDGMKAHIGSVAALYGPQA